ncbi:hypothetical protein ACLD43_01195 [Clostridium botulinum]
MMPAVLEELLAGKLIFKCFRTAKQHNEGIFPEICLRNFEENIPSFVPLLKIFITVGEKNLGLL